MLVGGLWIVVAAACVHGHAILMIDDDRWCQSIDLLPVLIYILSFHVSYACLALLAS